jgi:hypothetical protein
VHPLALATGAHQAGFAEVGEVAGDFRLGLLEYLDEIADADLAIAHEVEQAEAGGIGEGGEKGRELMAGVFREISLGWHGSIISGLTDMFAIYIFAYADM